MRKPTILSTKIISILLIIFLYCVGTWQWVQFFNKGDLNFKAYEWPKEFSYYYILQQSIKHKVIPYHVAGEFQGTTRFMGLPETNWSPQILLLPFFDPDQFILFQILLMFSLGFWGCLAIQRYFRLSFLAFAVLFLIFNFNGHIVTHLAVGHGMWSGYFLLSWFFLVVFKRLNEEKGKVFVLKMVVLLGFILLQGSLHIWVWCLMFLVFFGITRRDLLKDVLLIGVWTVSLSAVRLIPAALALKEKVQLFFPGFRTLNDVIEAMTVVHGHTYIQVWEFGIRGGAINWWELDHYMGLLGFVFVMYFGLFARFSKEAQQKIKPYNHIVFPLAVLFILALNTHYSVLFHLPIPLIQVERIPSRFLILPLLGLLILALIKFQAFWNARKPNVFLKVAFWVGLCLLALELFDHMHLWQIETLEQRFPNTTLYVPGIIKNASDSLYIQLIHVSFWVSVLAVVSLGVVGLRKRWCKK